MSLPDESRGDERRDGDIYAVVERWQTEDAQRKKNASLDWMAYPVLLLVLVAVFLVLPYYLFGSVAMYVVLGLCAAFCVFSLGYRFGAGRWPLE